MVFYLAISIFHCSVEHCGMSLESRSLISPSTVFPGGFRAPPTGHIPDDQLSLAACQICVQGFEVEGPSRSFHLR